FDEEEGGPDDRERTAVATLRRRRTVPEASHDFRSLTNLRPVEDKPGRVGPPESNSGREGHSALPVLRAHKPPRSALLCRMRCGARLELRRLWSGKRAGREVLRWMRRAAADCGAGVRRADVDTRARRRDAGRRATPADGALLRPGRLDTALAAARRGGVA